ncbi:MAG: substrate-binding domain-containing protein [Phycisphaerales bacterium]
MARSKAKSRRDTPPHVAILVDTATGWGRRLIGGILGYVRQHDPWYLWVEAKGRKEMLRLPDGWSGQGIIARVSTPEMARHLKSFKIPVINISSIKLRETRFPTVATDLRECGRLACEYFLNRGFKHFAYCGPFRLSYIHEHSRSFADYLEEAGYTCSIFRPRTAQRIQGGWGDSSEELIDWLSTLPKPVAVLTWETQYGRQVLDACRLIGLDVPGDVAVLGGDDDDLLCQVAFPPLSGIATPAEAIGYEAARMLDARVRGSRKIEQMLLKPSVVITRQSTDTLAIEDEELKLAIRFMREHVHEPIQIPDILRHVPISRSVLERRFQSLLGRSPAAEIRRLHLERARQLLVETDLSIEVVAKRSGFTSPEYFTSVFRPEYGQTPLQYRKHNRGH